MRPLAARGRRWLALLAVGAGCAASAPLPPAPPEAPLTAGPPRWEDWTPAAFARARAERKLILVNVSAAWCHGCHVMDDETFRDAEVARLVSERFVAIRVDADARPDVAERYELWGWPATAVLTPDARPVTERRGHQPPRRFSALLRELADAHAAGRDLARAAAPAPPPADLAAAASALRAQLDATYDAEQDGWGRPQKYPLAAPIEHAFLRAAVRPGEAPWRERALATLAAQTGLIDPVWGGMFQYSDDGTWGGGRHWEKLAAVQAGAIEAYVLAYRVTGDPRWLEPARQVQRYVVERLRGPDGAFHASQDADPPGGAGAAFYALDDAGRRAAAAPRVDASVYADLNGLLITALCHLYEVTDDPEVLAQALAAAEAVLRTHRAGKGLRHAATSPDAPLLLADQVAFADACLALSAVAPDRQRWLYLASDLARLIVRRFEAKEGGFLALARDAEDPLADARRPWRENAAAARFLLRFGSAWSGMMPVEEPARRALRVLLADGERARARGRLVADALLAAEEAALPDLAVVVAGPEDPRVGDLVRAARRLYAPRLSVYRDPSGRDYPTDRPAAFVCSAGACSAQVTDPTELPAALARALGAPR